MTPAVLEQTLRRHLRSEGRALKQLGAEDVLQISTQFWVSTAVEGVREVDGDGLVAYFELMRRRNTVYEFGVNRILRMEGKPTLQPLGWLPGFKLRFAVGFTPTLEVLGLQPVVATFACWRKSDVSSFVSQVEQSPQYKLVLQYKQRLSGIHMSECEGPPGQADHPTYGLSWAIA